MADEPRGIRNNNPGNLRKNNEDKWQGLSDVQDDEAFFRFKDPVYGTRALARTLIAYQDKNNLHTITQFIGRWAPSTENNTTAYVSDVADSMGINPTSKLDMHKFSDLRGLVVAIIDHENGGSPYSDAQITKALVLAGVEPSKRSLAVSPQIIGSAIAGAATVAQPVVETVRDNLQPLTDYSETLKHVFIGVSLLGVAIVAIAKFNERNKGIS